MSAVPPMTGCPWASTNPGSSILSAKVRSIVRGDLSSQKPGSPAQSPRAHRNSRNCVTVSGHRGFLRDGDRGGNVVRSGPIGLVDLWSWIPTPPPFSGTKMIPASTSVL